MKIVALPSVFRLLFFACQGVGSRRKDQERQGISQKIVKRLTFLHGKKYIRLSISYNVSYKDKIFLLLYILYTFSYF